MEKRRRHGGANASGQSNHVLQPQCERGPTSSGSGTRQSQNERRQNYREPDYSWAVIKKDWPAVDVKFSGDKTDEDHQDLGPGSRVQLSPFQISFYDAGGRLISSDAREMGWDGERVRCWKSMPRRRALFRPGRKSRGPLDKRGHALRDVEHGSGRLRCFDDPMYQTIPFFLGIRDGRAYGIFFDNTYRSTFDMGAESADSYSFGADGGNMDYYFFAGPNPKQIISRYTELVGRAPLPPMWTLGYLQSSAYYTPESTVRFVAENFSPPPYSLRRDFPGHHPHGWRPHLHLGQETVSRSSEDDCRSPQRRVSHVRHHRSRR